MMIKSWLIKIVSESKKYIACQVIANWIGLLANIVVTFSIADLLQDIAVTGMVPLSGVQRCLWMVLAAVVVRFACTMFAGRMSFLASDKVKEILRERIYRKLMKLGISYNQYIGTSEAVQVAGEGVDQLEIYFGSYLPQLFYSLIAPVTLFVVFLPISVKAAVILMICVPLIPVAIMGVQKIAKRLLKNYWGVYADLGGTFLENVQGLTTLKIYQADEEKHKEMNAQAERFRKITMRVLYMQLNSITVMDVVAYVGAVAGIIIAVLEFEKGNITFAGAFAIIMLSADFFIPLRQLGSFFHVAMNGMAASDKMKALFDLPEGEEKKEEIPEGSGEIRFENVHFSYDDTREILGGVTFTIPSRGFVSVVGESGCGKSTIAGLLTGTFKGYTGQITVGGTEIRDTKEESIMRHMTLVNHNSYLFAGTVRDNLKMGNPKASDEEMLEVLKEVNLYAFIMQEDGLDMKLREQGSNLSGGQRQRLALARAILHEFIMTLEKGYDTDAGELGDRLSGGECQRIGIARAFLHDAPLILLDEPTSNLDSLNEGIILKALDKKRGDKTIVLVSHRKSTMNLADKVYNVEHGRVC